ncbi:MAG: DNA repair protein RadC [Pseudomonadales bacterium]
MITKQEQQVINHAVSILLSKLQNTNVAYTRPESVKQFCQLNIGHLEHEVFAVLFLNNQHQLIKFEKLFRGTIDGASVHPREVVKACLYANAAAVIFTHNHPSGLAEPSPADINITVSLQKTLELIEIRVLDHIIVTHNQVVSFSERGLL